ncbi:MAG: sigmaK-factor processing regulatory BofA [Clostridiales bacterium]|nr:sigmaK-factor processing regulatory BofA [Clostridiales bacterium]
MNTWILLAPVLAVLGLIAVLLLAGPLGRLMGVLLRMGGAVLSLVLLNLVGTPLGLPIGINLLTIATAAVLGFPGVTALAVSRLILKL